VPSPFRRGRQHVDEESHDGPSTMTAPPVDSHAGEEQAEPRDAGSVSSEAAGAVYAGQPKAGTKVIVVADCQAADGHGEAYAFDRPEDAAEFIRSAVEDGMEPGHIHVFIGAEMRLNVAYRVEVDLESPQEPDPV
jgi:hypothetical protein